MNLLENKEIQIFQEYLRIPSVHPEVNYKPCVEFLKNQAESLQLLLNIFYPASFEKPIVIISWTGKKPELPSIFLNSHMDVVPVYEEYWTHPPFGAEIDSEGRIFARGAQDMKSVGMQYLAAIRSLKINGITFNRTIHVSFVPDEEISSHDGMVKFVQTDDFKRLNIGFGLDEACPSPNDDFICYYAERRVLQVNVDIFGTPGHGSILHEGTVGEKLEKFLKKVMEFRNNELKKLKDNPDLTIGDVTTINLTKLNGGVQINVLPPVITASFDIRLTADKKNFENVLESWCNEAGGNIKLNYEEKSPYVPPTKLDNSNLYWLTFKKTFEELNLKINPGVCPAMSDARCLRGVGIPVIGFSPINNTPLLIHDHDEFIRAETYLCGIEIYKKLIYNLGNL